MKLGTLLAEAPDPTPVHLEVWSRTLQADQFHVENWVKLNRVRTHTQPQPHRTEHDHERYPLPTPEGTASPEPQGPRVAPTPPMSPLVGAATTFTQVFEDFGAPAQVGPTAGGTWQSSGSQSVFAAVQPVATMVPTPMTPTSPVAPPPPSLSRAGAETKTKTASASAGVPLRYSSPILSTDRLEESVQRKKRKADVPSRNSSNAKSVSSPSLPRPGIPRIPSVVQPDRQEGSSRKVTTPIPRPAVHKANSPFSQCESIETGPCDFPSSSTSTSPLTAVASSLRAEVAPPASQPPLSTLLQILREKLAAAKAEPTPPPPKTLAELAQRLEPAFQFSEAVERGEYAAIGLVPATRNRREDEDVSLVDMDLSAGTF